VDHVPAGYVVLLVMLRDAETFETHRPGLLALAYRMLGDIARAEDMVQDAWMRWQNRQVEVDSPKAYLLTTVTRLCLDELDSARARHEESRSDRLPEPVDLDDNGIGRAERLDQISMAFLVLLQRLTPAERAVLLLHDVFEMSHGEIGTLLGKNDAACRQLLSRARENVAAEKRGFQTSREEHQRLLRAFVGAVNGDQHEVLLDLLAEDAVLIADAGEHGRRYGQLRNVGRPVVGRKRVAALLRAFARQDVPPTAEYRERTLNGEPAVVAFRDGRAFAVVFVSVTGGSIRRVFVQTDPERLRRLGPLDP
jgi:RNA polymerase sigma-70 factor (ECF subfamily)